MLWIVVGDDGELLSILQRLIKAQQECEEMYLDAAEPDPGEN